MKILVTGINGFVGAYLKLELEARGHVVIGLDLISNKDKNVYEVDITDKNVVADAVKRIAPEAIIHLAGIAQVHFDKPELIYTVNTIGTMNLLSACLKTDIKFLFISSSQVYGNGDAHNLPIIETHPLNPVNHYGASKVSAEMITRAYYLENNVQSVIGRPFNHTGKGQSPNFVVPKIAHAFREKLPAIELGNINTSRDFLDVRDVVSAYTVIIENFKAGEVYNIASGKGIRISDMFNILSKISGHKIEIVHREFLMRKSEIPSIVGSSDKLTRELGWKPKHAIEDTLASMLT